MYSIPKPFFFPQGTNFLPPHPSKLSLSLLTSPKEVFILFLYFLYHTISAFLKNIGKKSGRDDKTKLMRHTLSASDNTLFFHHANFLSTFLGIGSHVASFLGLAPTRIPRQTKGMLINLQFKMLAKNLTWSLSNPLPQTYFQQN